MRSFCLTLTVLLLLTSTDFAQAPPTGGQQPGTPPATPADPGRDRLTNYLKDWQKSMEGLQTLSAQCMRTDIDKTFGQTDVFVGSAQFMRPNLASLALARKDKPDAIAEKFICTGTYLYQFVPQNKEVRVHQLPPPKQGQVADDSFMALLFGMKASDAMQRFDLKLVKEDQYYIYVEVTPRNNADKVEFQKARLVLNKDNLLPRQLWFEQPNRNEVTWDIPKIESNGRLNRKDFEAPTLPPGWKMVQMPVPPRVVREQK